MDKICVFCFKLAQNFVMPGARLTWRRTHFQPRLIGRKYGKTLILRTKSWSRLNRQVGLLAGKYGSIGLPAVLKLKPPFLNSIN